MTRFSVQSPCPENCVGHTHRKIRYTQPDGKRIWVAKGTHILLTREVERGQEHYDEQAKVFVVGGAFVRGHRLPSYLRVILRQIAGGWSNPKRDMPMRRGVGGREAL